MVEDGLKHSFSNYECNNPFSVARTTELWLGLWYCVSQDGSWVCYTFIALSLDIFCLFKMCENFLALQIASLLTYEIYFICKCCRFDLMFYSFFYTSTLIKCLFYFGDKIFFTLSYKIRNFILILLTTYYFLVCSVLRKDDSLIEQFMKEINLDKR